MRRELARSAITILLLLGWGHAHALGLGPATLSSDLSSPLQAQIPITRIAGSGIDPEAVTVDVPGFNEHAQLGFPEPVLPADLDVELVRDAGGGASLRLSTQRAVREPVLRFLLRATWPGGSTVREYTLLLDLPRIVRPMRAASPASGPVRATPRAAITQSTAQPTASGNLSGNPFQAAAPARAGARYGPVALGDTLHAILGSAYPGRANESLAQLIVARNPRAFAAGDPDRLLLGATLDLPPAEQLANAGSTAPSRTQPVAAPDAAPVASDYLVRPGDTLYAIARTIPGTGGAQLAATARRLFETNPQAFIDGDINRLRAGATLRLGVAPAATAGTPASPAMAMSPAAPATGAASSQDLANLRHELDEAQSVLSAERERQTTLRDRLARTEREIASLLERDAVLSTDTAALREQLAAAGAAAATPAPSRASAPQAPVSPAGVTAAQAAATSAPSRASAPQAPVSPAGVTAAQAAAPPAPSRASAPQAPVSPTPTQRTATLVTTPADPPAPDPIAPRTAPVSITASAPVGVEPAGSDLFANLVPNRTWLAAGAGIIALLAVIAVRRRRARMHEAGTNVGHARHGDEQATRRRLAEVRDAHAARASAVATGSTPARTATAEVRHTNAARASALAKEAAVHLAYGEHGAAHTSIVKAIKLAPHQDEHKMLLMTVYQAKGQHEKARAIVDELLNRREQLSREVRAQVEQQVQQLAR